jgi:hypothetical protein
MSFPAIDQFDQQERLIQIRNQSLLLRQEDKQRQREANAVFAAMGRLPKQATVEERLLTAIQLERDLVVALEGIESDRQRCIKLLELIAAASRERALNTETLTFLKGERDRVTDVLRIHTVRKRRLQAVATKLKAILRNTPPPEQFENGIGVNMILVVDGKESFYISQLPVSADKLAKAYADPTNGVPEQPNWYEAKRFCQWLSEAESVLYRLPTVQHMTAFSQAGGKVEEPVWTQTAYEPESVQERSMMTRFGVGMVMVYDQEEVLGSGNPTRELPFARYPQMRFHVVTPAETGWRFRWNALKRSLEK